MGVEAGKGEPEGLSYAAMVTQQCILNFWGNRGQKDRHACSLVPALSSEPPAHCSPNNPLKHHFHCDVPLSGTFAQLPTGSRANSSAGVCVCVWGVRGCAYVSGDGKNTMLFFFSTF